MSAFGSGYSGEPLRRLILVGVARLVNVVGVLGGLLFGTAGSIDWPMAWVLLVMMPVGAGLNVAVLTRKNPEVLRARLQRPRGAPKWDLILISAISLLGLMTLAIAGLDHRARWAPPLPLPLEIVGAVMVVGGNALSLWAMAVNRFFTGIVRVQTESGHRTISAGPYAIVRHPGYAGWLVVWWGILLMLGSAIALSFSVLPAAFLIVRTALEDKLLRRDLAGYDDYVREVRYRLIPGIW